MSTFAIPLTVVEQELSSDVETLRAELSLARAELLELANRIAAWPDPPRDYWTRKTYVETFYEEAEEEDPQLTRPPDARIARVTLSADGRYATSYGPDGERLEAFSGTMDTIGWALLAISGNLVWERLCALSSPETPLPGLSDETEPQLTAISKIA